MPSQRLSFEQFVQDHTGTLLRTAFLICWDDAEAEDLVQECLLRVSRRWRRVRDMDMPVAYARRVLINLALAGRGRRLRRGDELASEDRRGTPAIDGWAESADPSAELALNALGERAELVEALGHLTPQQRTVLMLRYFEDLPEARVAELLGCSTGTVKSSASRGLARLRQLLPPPTSTTELHKR